MQHSIAYLSDGKLFLKEPGRDVRLIESPFVQQMLDRQEKTRERHEWKRQGMGWSMTQGLGLPQHASGARRVRTEAVGLGPDGADLVYAIQTETVGGLFAWTRADNSERRLLHRNGFAARDLNRHPTTNQLAMSVRGDDFASHIAVMDFGGRGVKQVTEGDSLDEAPSWVGGQEKTLVYQSAGIGRNSAGFMVARGTYGVMKLDLISGQIDTLLEDDDYDYLLPRQTAEGTLYYIRRPYQPLTKPASPWAILKDALLFPFGLVMSFVHFFNWFSMVFRRKPLLTAGGPPKEAPDSRYMMLWGMMIDAEKAMRSKDGDGKSLVPTSWKLMKRTVDGSETEIASGVLAYDLAADGAVVYTNGSTVWRWFDGKRDEVCAGKMIERIVAV
jgi:hypothetical protein